MKNYRDTHTKSEFKHFVDEIAFKPVRSEDNSIFYDKKYFDYLPTDDSKQQPAADEVPSQRENHRRLKRQTVDCKRIHCGAWWFLKIFFSLDYFFTDHETPNRWYLPVRPPNNDYLPPVVPPPRPPYVMQPSMYNPPNPPNVGNRGFFDLQDNFIFDYVYDPQRSTGFGGKL